MIEDCELNEINASEILDAIQKGEPVRYDHVRITGDLDLRNLNLPTESIDRTEYQQRILNLPSELKVILSPIHIIRSEFKGITFFKSCLFKNEIQFFETTFSEIANFDDAKFNNYADFRESNFIKGAYFDETKFCCTADFDDARFGENAGFVGAVFSEEASFSDVTFYRDAVFVGSTFHDEANFTRALFNLDANFSGATFSGEILTFKNAKFSEPLQQEGACRRAKNLLEKNGDREEAGYHFYREMEGKRKQKDWYIRYPEFIFIQLIFGYGVHPFRLMGCWFGFAFIFAAIYSLGSGIDPVASLLQNNATLADYVWFSIATAVTPGYAGYKPTPDFKLVAGFEAIFGTFMWAAFIATFARKYMK